MMTATRSLKSINPLNGGVLKSCDEMTPKQASDCERPRRLSALAAHLFRGTGGGGGPRCPTAARAARRIRRSDDAGLGRSVYTRNDARGRAEQLEEFVNQKLIRVFDWIGV